MLSPKNILLYFSLLFSSTCISQTPGPDYEYTLFTNETGLPSNIVYHVYEDYRGFLWICTDKGLIKYNGKYFTVFTTKDGLPDDEVFSVWEDLEHRLWISCFTGPLCYIENNIIHRFLQLTSDEDWNNNKFVTIFRKDKSGNFYVGQIHSTTIYKINNLQIKKKIKHPDFESQRGSIGGIKIKNENALQIYVNYSKELPAKRFTLDLINNTLNHDTIPYGLLNLNTSNQLIDIEGKQLTNTVTGKSKQLPDFINPTLLLGYASTHNSHLYLLKDRFIIENNNTYSTFKIENPSSFCVTKSGAIWLSSVRQGLFKLNFTTSKFISDKNSSVFIKSLTDTIIHVFDSKIEFKTKSGLRNFSIKNKIVINEDIYNLEVINDKLFLCTSYRIMLFDINTGRQIYSSSSNFIKNFALIKGVFYLNTTSSIDTFNTETRVRGVIFNPTDRMNDVFAHNSELFFLRDHKLYKWSYQTKPVLIFDKLKIKRGYQLGNFLFALTSSNELFKLNLSDWTFIKLSEEKFNKFIYINRNKFAAECNDGLFLFELKKNNPLTARISDDKYPKNYKFIYEDKNRLIFNTGYDSYICQSTSEETNKNIITVYYNYLSYNTDTSTYRVLTTKYNEEKLLQLNFSYLDLKLNKIRLKTKLNNGTWEEKSPSENLYFPLRLGHNNILVVVINDEGKDIQKFSFEINTTTPYYKTIWFNTVLIAFIILAIAIFVIYYYKRVQEKKGLKEIEFLKSEFRSLNALMNPHFIFNCMNSISYLVAAKENSKAEKYLNRLSRLIRLNMQNIKSDFITLGDELSLVENYFELEKMRFKSEIELIIRLSDPELKNSIYLPPLSIQPLVENCIIHGFNYGVLKGKITINVGKSGNESVISVLDDGLGFSENQGQNMALNSLSKRLENISAVSKRKYSYKKLNTGKGFGVELSIKEN